MTRKGRLGINDRSGTFTIDRDIEPVNEQQQETVEKEDCYCPECKYKQDRMAIDIEPDCAVCGTEMVYRSDAEDFPVDSINDEYTIGKSNQPTEHHYCMHCGNTVKGYGPHESAECDDCGNTDSVPYASKVAWGRSSIRRKVAANRRMSDTAEADTTETSSNLPATESSAVDRQLWRISERTRMDGSTEVPVVEWMPDDYSDHRPHIRYEHPIQEGKTITESFDMPKNESSHHRFVRFLEQYGLSIRTASEIAEFEVEVEYDEGAEEWNLVVPPYSEPIPTKKERAKQAPSIAKDTWGSFYDGVLKSDTVVSGAKVFGIAALVISAPITALPFFVWAAKDEDVPEAIMSTGILVLASIIFWLFFSLLDGSTTQILFEATTNAAGETVVSWNPMEFSL